MAVGALHNEQELLLQAADGNQEAYGQLYSHYYPALLSSLSFISRSAQEAEEVIQEVFVKAWISRETLILVQSFGDYIFTVARNILFDRMRKGKSRENAEQEYSRRLPLEHAQPHDDLLFKQYYTTAYAVLGRLSKQKQQIFLLRTQENMTLDEIAQEMGISRSAVKKHLYSALEYMKKALIQHGDWLTILLIFWHTLSEIKKI